MEEIKQKANKLIEELGVEHPLLDNLKQFISTYDGTNKEDFLMLIFSIVTSITKMADLETKATGYTNLVDENKSFSAKLSVLKNDYEKLASGKSLTEPFNSSE